MSNNNQTVEHIHQLFLEKLNIAVPSIDTDIIDTRLLDSLTLMSLILHLQQEFGVEISIDELEIDNFRSIRKIGELVGHQNGLAKTE